MPQSRSELCSSPPEAGHASLRRAASSSFIANGFANRFTKNLAPYSNPAVDWDTKVPKEGRKRSAGHITPLPATTPGNCASQGMCSLTMLTFCVFTK